MKKSFTLTLVLILTLSLFTLTACGGDKTDKTSSDKAIGSSASTPQDDKVGESVSQPETVVVPNVVGMNVDEAVKVLEDNELTVDISDGSKHYTSNEYLENYNKEDFIAITASQDIKAGVLVVKNTAITIYLYFASTN